MKETAADERARPFRLRGEVAGVERVFLLTPGHNRIGSLGANDVVLPVRGVSRQHALLSVGVDGLILEDLGSKNGTLLNDVRIGRASVSAGDRIGFGPVRLRLEEIDRGDTELAIFIQPGEPTPPTGLPADDTTSISAGDRRTTPATWLGLVDGFLARLGAVPEPDLAGALALLVTEMPALGACVVEWSRGTEPVVLVSAGQIESPLEHPGLLDFVRTVPRPGASGEISTAILSGDPVLACALLSGPSAERLGLFVWGEYRGRSESEPLLRTLIGLLGRFRPQPLHVPRRAPPRSEARLAFPDGYVAGDSAEMASLYAQMVPLLQGDLPVLILGETGVGKELLARTLHASSSRRNGPFVAINCAAIPAELLEAEMFGIGKGIATGVVERPGKFQLAAKGTLFLDEIGDMPIALQAKLLRALQEKEVQPVGSRPVPVDIRVVTATNSDLTRRMDEGRFRRDLYYRVAGYVLPVPPLRNRVADIPALVEAFVQEFALETSKSIRGVTVRALRALVEYEWPGNVRELQHEVRRVVYLCPDRGAIDSSMLSPPILSPAADRSSGDGDGDRDGGPVDGSLSIEDHAARLESRLIREALARTGGNRTQAAKLLGISRNGLAIRIERLGLGG